MQHDRTLVDAALSRKPGAFAALVSRHQRLVWHIVYRMLQDAEETRDVSQETFLKVHQNLHRFRFESSLSTWIGRIGYHTTVRHLERKRIPLAGDDQGADRLEQVPDGSDMEAMQDNRTRNLLLNKALKSLPPIERTVITLYHLDEYSIAEVAAMTDLKEGTVKSHLFRARQKLKAVLTRSGLHQLEGRQS